jgi:hypothetical protein|nr:hypothetical protein [Kofleriaceae bacterium]
MKLAIAGLLACALGATAVAGCTKTQASTPCSASIHGILDRALAASENDEEAVREFERRLGDLLTNLCTEDRWSAPMLACLDEATDAATARQCASKLSADQLAHLNKKMGEAMGVATGSGQAKH